MNNNITLQIPIFLIAFYFIHISYKTLHNITFLNHHAKRERHVTKPTIRNVYFNFFRKADSEHTVCESI